VNETKVVFEHSPIKEYEKGGARNEIKTLKFVKSSNLPVHTATRITKKYIPIKRG
jgi:hypothetical protein